MWHYTSVSREEFDQRKTFVHDILLDLGCEILDEDVYRKARIERGYDGNYTRLIYKFQNGYFRIDEILFEDKPFIVLEWVESFDEMIVGRMEDVEPFPYDLPDYKIVKEVKFALGIEPYPDTYPDY